MGRKTLRTNLQSNENLNTYNNSINNYDNPDKFVNEEDNSSVKKQNQELNEFTDSNVNFNNSQIQKKLEKNSESFKEDKLSSENNKEINHAISKRKNSDLFNNKRFDVIFNLDCNFENAEDMINFDCFSNGIFSNKEITFDENYNSQGEDLNKINPGDYKVNEIKEPSNNKKDSVNKEVFENEDLNEKSETNVNIDENIKDTGSLSLSKNNYNKQTINDSYKIINEKPFYEKKNMNTLKKFFNPKTKNDNNTIKSIDDSTTVSTQFTKEKIQTKNSQKSKLHISNKNEIRETHTQNNDYSNKQAVFNSDTKTMNKNVLLGFNKNYLLEKEDVFLHKKTSGNENYSVKSEGTSSKCLNYNRVYIDNSNQLMNTNSYNIRSNHNQNKFNLIEKDKNENSEIVGNASLNLNCSNTSKEKNLNGFCIQYDFRKSFNNKGDSQSNEIYKNLLATAKYFDLDG